MAVGPGACHTRSLGWGHQVLPTGGRDEREQMATSLLECAGGVMPEARDQIRRYCGLPWSGGDPEVWAYEYFDSLPNGSDDLVGPPDTLGAASLHPGFGRAEMVWFNGGGAEACEAWLSGLPRDVELVDADEATIKQLAELPAISEGIGLSIVSKVTHRKRPQLIPIFDRSLVDRYRRLTDLRGEAAWPALVRALQADLALEGNRRFFNELRAELATELAGPVPSDLRMMDIAIWMAK